LQTQIGSILHLHLEAAHRAHPAHRWRRKYGDIGILDPGKALPQGLRDGIGIALWVRTAFLEGLEHGEDRPGVRLAGAGEHRPTDEPHGVGETWRLEHTLGRPPDHSLRALERGGVGELRIDDQIALVLLRDETGRHPSEAHIGQADEPEIDEEHERGHAQQAADQSLVECCGLTERSVEAAEEPSQKPVEHAPEPVPAGPMRLQQERAERGAQCERVEGRDHRRDCDGEGELAVKLPGDAAPTVGCPPRYMAVP
jgi:hypothetical protein